VYVKEKKMTKDCHGVVIPILSDSCQRGDEGQTCHASNTKIQTFLGANGAIPANSKCQNIPGVGVTCTYHGLNLHGISDAVGTDRLDVLNSCGHKVDLPSPTKLENYIHPNKNAFGGESLGSLERNNNQQTRAPSSVAGNAVANRLSEETGGMM
jgi:hypothetical protein